MGPSFEQIVDESILPNDFDNLFKLSNEEMKCLINNRRVVNLLFKNMDRELSDLIHKDDKLKEIRFDAHHLWKFIESICEEDDDEDDQEEEKESLEECTTTTIHSHPFVTPSEEQGAESTDSAGSHLEPIRSVRVTGQTCLTKNQKKKSKKCSRRRSRQAQASETSASSTSLEKKIQMLKAQVEKLTSEHVALPGTHLELEKSYEMLVDSHVSLQVANEIVMTSVTSYQPLTHTCTCSQIQIMLSCDKLCCSQATNSCVEHVVAESCDDLIVKENDELKREVEELKIEMIKLKSKGQVQPSQDNRDNMVKKLEKGSNSTNFAPQQDQAKEESLVQFKRSNMESKNKTKLSRKEKQCARTRVCFRCKEKGHLIAACPIQQSKAQSHSYKRNQDCNSWVKLKVNKAKHRTCYTYREKGHLGKDCPKGKSPNSNLVHYDFTRLRKDKDGTCAIRVINFPQTSIRAIWVPKHLVSNLYGPSKIWVPKGTC
ncbi:hypothetical protein PVAP13_1NG547001 [Panicum virgatum]|uniref:CCHC-type domain-containing protein n=1 Tax=Panicum virgatum TaxID=38727 RepID=A0A8T0XD03_PANVG|nr:hypothetical protein PVAP13_1NG547001 [Panicum virgatum]